ARLQVVVRSSPSGAQIVVDGKRRGVTPARLALAEGSAIVVRRAGYRPSTVRATRAGAIDVRLVPVRRPGVRPASTGGETLD
ncbi:MAG: PEGA domain-containing protein, partial [Kofleriaceae bacterium]